MEKLFSIYIKTTRNSQKIFVKNQQQHFIQNKSGRNKKIVQIEF